MKSMMQLKKNMRDTNDKNIKVMIIHPINRIKKKTGSSSQEIVTFTKEQIKQANDVCSNFQNEKDKEVEKIIYTLIMLWKTIKNIKETPQKQKHTQTMFLIYINRLEDLSKQFSEVLIQDFTMSLKQFLETAFYERKEHQIIIQAYLDVINLAHHQKIKDSEKNEAARLKEMLKIAIKKNN